jgi:hypothetical protein
MSLPKVPAAARKAARIMVTRHPLSKPAQVLRKTVVRTEGAESGPAGGLPSIGGIAMLESTDESQVEYVPLGMVRVLFTGFEGAKLADLRDAAEPEASSVALVEPETEGEFEVKTDDLIMVMPGEGIVVGYSVDQVISGVNIAPFVPKVTLVPQGDLMFIPEVAASMAGR